MKLISDEAKFCLPGLRGRTRRDVLGKKRVTHIQHDTRFVQNRHVRHILRGDLLTQVDVCTVTGWS